MGLHRNYNDNHHRTDLNYDDEVMDPIEDSNHKRHVRQLLEERLERKRLKAELDDELEGEFNWDDFER